MPESFGTAWGTLEQLGLYEGQSLLVHGGSSSVLGDHDRQGPRNHRYRDHSPSG